MNEDLTERLSAREIDVLKLVAEGLGNKQIARRLNIEDNTVKTHLSRMYLKTFVQSRAALVAYGFRNGYLS